MNAEQPRSSADGSGTFPRGGTAADIWEFVLRYAVRAPSGHNTQPWRFAISGAAPGDGRAVAVLLLRATAYGLAASFLNQPIEVPALRVRLGDLLASSDSPQLLLRVVLADASDTGTSS